VDEAHRALKKYAYCSVVKHVGFRHAHFRVLALSATPGSDVAGVQDVIDNLRIAHVEVRTEEDPDVARYTHHRLIEKIICEEGPVVKAGLDALQRVAEPFLKRLHKAGAIHSTDLSTLRAYTVLQAGRDNKAVSYVDRHVAHKLASAADALRHYGTTGALDKLESVRTTAQEVQAKLLNSEAVPPGDRALQRLAASPSFLDALKALRSSGEHPKTTKLRELLVDHFVRSREAHKSSRAMIFTGTRQSVDEIGEALSRAPGDLLRVQRFVGQGGESGMKQSSQKNAVESFLRNDSNVLVATCIAEEGLDIGAVDVCVFYDQVGSPIRMVQRMGRTARKRTGRVLLLMVPGEEKKFETSGKRSAAVVRALREMRGLRLRTDLSKRLVPRRIQPSWPRRVDKRLSIDAWRSSQVGGALKRKVTDPARCNAKHDRSWRLTEKQLQSVHARGWRGPVSYKARLADGWRRSLRSGHAGRPPPRTGSVVAAPAASSRSAGLRAVADFVALQGFDDVYDLDRLQEHNGTLASVAFQKKLGRARAVAADYVWCLDASADSQTKEVPWMCLECFAAGQTGDTCAACGAQRSGGATDVWGFDDPSPAGSPVKAPPDDRPAARMERFLEANGEAPPAPLAPPTPAWDWIQESAPAPAPAPPPQQFRLPSGSDTLPSPPEVGPPRPAWCVVEPPEAAAPVGAPPQAPRPRGPPAPRTGAPVIAAPPRPAVPPPVAPPAPRGPPAPRIGAPVVAAPLPVAAPPPETPARAPLREVAAPQGALSDDQRVSMEANKQRALQLRIAKNREKAMALRAAKRSGSSAG
jgi:Fanconi anemia group M protein